MANQLAGNPWLLDGSSLNTVLVKTWIKVEHIEFSGYANATASNCQLADRNGNVIWQATGAFDGEEVRSGKIGWVNGLQNLAQTDGLIVIYCQ